MSLIRKASGKFLLLDCYEPDEGDHAEIMALINNGSEIEALLNVHPFHAVHCDFVERLVPHARIIGTRGHHDHLPHLRWDPALIEDPASQQQFSDTLEFSIPSGVGFISDDPDVHVGSVVARHRASRIVHSDDTLRLPMVLPPSHLTPLRGLIVDVVPQAKEFSRVPAASEQRARTDPGPAAAAHSSPHG